ncbi:Nucleotidylyl transferase [Saitoella complicata NRRL Y-17804]|uniref:Cytidyltransferase-like domain-containing protein n=1 Tax=Saitoella complicata (strain BCRC 22490 / CBS 7301 / JCM 7358 / NBRC 10748 / NRRL Y-17804) TaxID=698492 RepID=A0A0E9NS93_SAICN|nr:Nucleotidylyl transferase [Saitoella complicata NRRL Y-17804]ODQ51274.1 Nucleotidylyl transferase [Saitoella complicata NRRL Y-17804]GAO52724.1 hypothetical protein G7K_6794-t1 [Saitoella complicata NRRL Y-17804]
MASLYISNLLLIRLTDATFRDPTAFYPTIDAALRATNGSGHLTIVLSHPSFTSSNRAALFVPVQRLISLIYIECVRISDSRELTSAGRTENQDFTILLDGERVVEEEWECVCVPQGEEELLEEFLRKYREKGGSAALPTLILPREGSPDPTPESTRPSSAAGPEPVPEEEEKKGNFGSVAVGGTFDHLHPGHKILLTLTAFLASTKIICGVTAPSLLTKKAYAEFMESVDVRIAGVKSFLEKVRRGKEVEVEVVEIQDPFGPTITDAGIEALVVSRETISGGKSVNEERRKRNMKELEIFVIDVVTPKGIASGEESGWEGKMSSTEIRRTLLERENLS